MNEPRARANILEALATGDDALFRALLDAGFKEAAREAAAESHALGLEVADGRASEERSSYTFGVAGLVIGVNEAHDRCRSSAQATTYWHPERLGRPGSSQP